MTKQELLIRIKAALRGAGLTAAKWHVTQWGRGGSTHHAGFRIDPVPGRAPFVSVRYEQATRTATRQLGPADFLRYLRVWDRELAGYRRILEEAGLTVETIGGGGVFDEAHRTWPRLVVRPPAPPPAPGL